MKLTSFLNIRNTNIHLPASCYFAYDGLEVYEFELEPNFHIVLEDNEKLTLSDIELSKFTLCFDYFERPHLIEVLDLSQTL